MIISENDLNFVSRVILNVIMKLYPYFPLLLLSEKLVFNFYLQKLLPN